MSIWMTEERFLRHVKFQPQQNGDISARGRPRDGLGGPMSIWMTEERFLRHVKFQPQQNGY